VLAWGIATGVVGLLSLVIGAKVLRLRGHYFAIGTIAIVELFRLVISAASGITGGGDGLNVPLMRASPAFVLSLYLYVMLGLMVAAFALNAWVGASKLGFGLRCIRQNEDASEMVGIATTRYKIAAYVLSSVLCGTVGAVYASWVGYIDPTDSFDILLTLKVPVMVMLGGLGSVLGPAVGAGVFVLVEEFFWARFLEWNRAIIGFLIVGRQWFDGDEELYVIEANPRASRTVPFVSKATGLPLAKLGCRVMLGEKLAAMDLPEDPCGEHISVKEAVLPFDRFAGADALLVLPPYLVQGPPSGTERYITAVAGVSSLPVIALTIFATW
jgi:hypothetical protein